MNDLIPGMIAGALIGFLKTAADMDSIDSTRDPVARTGGGEAERQEARKALTPVQRQPVAQAPVQDVKPPEMMVTTRSPERSVGTTPPSTGGPYQLAAARTSGNPMANPTTPMSPVASPTVPPAQGKGMVVSPGSSPYAMSGYIDAANRKSRSNPQVYA